MSKKILFMSSAKLTAICFGLLLAVFCTIGMSFTPATDDNLADPNDSTAVHGPRRTHEAGSGCASSTKTNDYGNVIAVSLGGGTVTISNVSGGGAIDAVYTGTTSSWGSSTGTTLPATSTSTAANYGVKVVWKCNETDKTTGTEANHKHKFKWSATPDASHTFDGWSTTSTGEPTLKGDQEYEQIMDAGVYNSKSGGGYSSSNPKTYTLYAHFSEKHNAIITMPKTSMGAYTYSCADGNGTINTSTSGSIETENEITFTAANVSGYKVFGWYTSDDNGTTRNYIGYGATLTIGFKSNVTIYVEYISSSIPVFEIEETHKQYYDLNAAISACGSNTRTIVLVGNGTLSAGTYTIGTKQTLLIPFNDSHTLYETEPTDVSDSPKNQSAFKTLTMDNGAHIVVNGKMSLSAQMQRGQPYGGSVYGKYGKIHMNEGSKITISNSATLYCWGYITGEGTVEALSGSTVYEYFQIACWRGGNCANSIVDNKSKYRVFPLAQYYIQNVEAYLVFNAGSTEYIYTGVGDVNTGIYGYLHPKATALLIGSSDGLFQLKSGKMTRKYDAVNDRQKYKIEGNCTLGSVHINMYIDVYSYDYVMPLTNNMDITIHSGTTSCNYEIAILPGASIKVDNGATVSFGTNGKLYVYDKAEWPDGSTTAYNYHGTIGSVSKTNAAFIPVAYTATSITTARTYASMADAKLDINGTFITANGHLYTTDGGAHICSSEGTGRIQFSAAPGTESKTYQAVQESNYVGTWAQIPITSAKLHNATQWYSNPYTGNGKACEYLATAGAAAGTITYANGHWGWVEIWEDEDGTVLKAINTCTQQAGTAPSNPSQPCKTFAGWSDETSTINQEVIHTATYTMNTHKLAWDFDGGTPSGSYTEANNALDCGSTITYPALSKTGYTFAGWSTSATSMPDADLTIKASWTPRNDTHYTVHHYKQALDGSYSSTPDDTDNLEGTTDASVTPDRKSYEGFDAPAGLTVFILANGSLVVEYQYARKSYELSWVTDGDALTGSYTSGSTKYEASITAPNTPTKTGYTFAGWHNGTSVVTPASTMPTAALTYTAQWTPNSYSITYKDQDDVAFSGTHADGYPTSHTYGTATTLKTATKTGYDFGGWFANKECTGEAVTSLGATAYTADITLYAKWTINSYEITWLNDDNSLIDKTMVEYGVVPTHADATKANTAEWSYTFTGWDNTPVAVTGDATYKATFSQTKRKYTITWWDAQEILANHIIAEQEYEYGEIPSYTYNKPSDYAYSYEVLGWTPALVPVTADKKYTALYNAIPLTLVVDDEKTISDNVTLNSTTVRVSGALHIANNAKLTTTDLILEAGESQSGEILGNVVANNVYFDLAIEADKRHWNVFGVPFEIGDLDNTKLQYKNSGETTWHNMILGTHYDITYHDEATRASRGPVYDCWKYIEDLPAGNRTLQPGVAYSISLLFHVDTLRFTKASDSPIHYSENVDLVNTNTGDATNGGWNGIANPTTYHTLLATGVDMIQIHDGGEIGHDTYDAYPIASYKFVVGKAGYVQVHTSASVLSVDEAGGQDPIPSPVHAAPRRSNGITASELYTVELSAENMRTDRVYVKADEDKADEYTIGSDVMKLSTSQARPQIWVEQYNVKLCKSTMAPVNGQTVYPLGLYAPVAGEYTITNNQSAEVEEENTLYLTYDGLPIWNLTDAPYSIQLEKGTNMHYGLLLVRNYAPSVTTGNEEIQTGLQAAQKVLWNNQVYILRGGEVYTVTGKKVQ